QELTHGYYDWPIYWFAPTQWGGLPVDDSETPATAAKSAVETAIDSDLRSTRNVTGFHIAATDGDIGHVEDFLIEDEDWRIKCLVANTRNWIPGSHVLVAPGWIDEVDWVRMKVVAHVPRESIRHAPEFRDPHNPHFIPAAVLDLIMEYPGTSRKH
ncbi:MAG: hypothetical protein K1X53_11935, partial [Candidatus Sumerlaeaceae bacterium]|nr:hypothetical protein [Candidatus Sumerlaeaceae bacterium]